jgi:anti-sigma factor RsiW
MPSCREIDPLFVPYVDGVATADERAVVDAHLKACPKCRHNTALQAAVRTTVREKLCRPRAPEALRVRCRAAARAGIGPFGTTRSTIATLSMAAALALVVGGVLMYSLTGLPTVLAAQLTIDHVKCFAVEAGETPIPVPEGEAQYERDYGHDVRLPRREIAGLQLVGMRRCYCGEGAAAHAMYRLNGRPVSLYVIPDVNRARASAEVLGHDAIIWSRQNVTYVLVSREPRETLEQLALQMNAGL